MNKGCICAVYVDDTIFAGTEVIILEREIKSLGVISDECRESFQLRGEGEVGYFLGIRIEKQKNNSFILTQTGLIAKLMKAAGMEDSNKCATPETTTSVGDDIDVELFK
jgi:hypothetical protein